MSLLERNSWRGECCERERMSKSVKESVRKRMLLVERGSRWMSREEAYGVHHCIINTQSTFAYSMLSIHTTI